MRDPAELPISRRHVREAGVADLLELERSVSGALYHRAVVVGEVMDGPVVRGTAELDPAHPLHPGAGALRTHLRRSAQITRQDVATSAAQADLLTVSTISQDLDASALPDPTVDEGDLHESLEPVSGTDARTVIDTVTQPLLAGAMSLSGRVTHAVLGCSGGSSIAGSTSASAWRHRPHRRVSGSGARPMR